MPTVTFPFELVRKTTLGSIYRPYISIKAKSKIGEWIPLKVLVDTGADYTLLPIRFARLLGIDLKDCKMENSAGVGGHETTYQYNLTVQIGSWQSRIPVGFMAHDNIPGLLGRLNCLEKLKLTFENKSITIESS